MGREDTQDGPGTHPICSRCTAVQTLSHPTREASLPARAQGLSFDRESDGDEAEAPGWRGENNEVHQAPLSNL